MRIASITAGAAGVYCGSCLQDNTLAGALMGLGHEVALIPTYTPIRTDEHDNSIDQVFCGAINVYLQEKLPVFKHTPRFFDRLLDRRSLLNWVSRFSSSTSAEDLGALTLAIVSGEKGSMAKELRRLVAWLADEFKPEIVHLTNSMFLGFAGPIRRALSVPIVCSLQGEEIFLDDLVEPYKSRVFSKLYQHAADVDAFVVPNSTYAGFMADYLRVAAERIQVTGLGLDLDGYHEQARGSESAPFVIGYLARIDPAKGLSQLVDAFRLLCDELGQDKLRLRVAGYLGPRDHGYLDEQKKKIESWGLGASFEHVGELDKAQKIRFLSELDVLSVPTVYHESKGRYVLEALASGVPVVQPSHGSFPELIELTGGGVLVEPGSPQALARGIRSLIDDPERRSALGRQGRQVVQDRFSANAMARATLDVYEQLLSMPQPAARPAQVARS